MITKRIDFAEEAQAIYEEDLVEMEKGLDEIVEQAKEEYGSFSDTPDEVIEAYEELDNERIETKGTADALLRAIIDLSDRFSLEDWTDEDGFMADEFLEKYTWQELTGLCVFTIEEFSGGALSKIQDQISDDSFTFDADTGSIEGMPKQGRAKVIMLQHGVIDKPENLENIANLNSSSFEFLFDRLNELNTTGSVDMGNSSLRERMESGGS